MPFTGPRVYTTSNFIHSTDIPTSGLQETPMAPNNPLLVELFLPNPSVGGAIASYQHGGHAGGASVAGRCSQQACIPTNWSGAAECAGSAMFESTFAGHDWRTCCQMPGRAGLQGVVWRAAAQSVPVWLFPSLRTVEALCPEPAIVVEQQPYAWKYLG